MSNIIQIKRSTVAAKVPVPADLQAAEIAVNLVDEKLYMKTHLGDVVQIGEFDKWSATNAAIAGYYAVGDRVWGSDLAPYELNADKGGAVPGDPTQDPVSGDGSDTADWVFTPLVTFTRDSYVATLAQAAFTLSRMPTDIDSIDFVVEGAPPFIQGIHYNVAGTTLTLVANVAANIIAGRNAQAKYY